MFQKWLARWRGAPEAAPVPAEPVGGTMASNSLGFFDPRHPDTGFLSNFYRAPFQLQGFEWPTVEHFYQAHKCRDAAYQAQVRGAGSPKEAKAMGREAPASALRPDWDDWRMTVMVQALVAKFVQNPELIERLLATGEAMLVEASPHDAFWGAGANDVSGPGENRLGALLTSLRGVLRGCREQGLTSDESGLFSVLLEMHLTWWGFEAGRAQAQQAALGEGLGLMVRDTELSDQVFNRYVPGLIVQEPTFLTGSADARAGLAAPVRFALLSPSLRLLGDLSPHAGARPCMCPAGMHWKVMGRTTVDDLQRSLIVLLQVPPEQAYLFDSLIFTNAEAGVYHSVKEGFLATLAADPNPACQQPEWLEQVRDPVGFSASGACGPCWINGMAQVQPGP